MIPVSLTLQGLYSYQARQTIDFEKLLQGGVFGIFGKTGSGKSTILEAITLALFNKVERLNSLDNVNYNLMNQKSNELFVDFTFKNHDEKLYRFKVAGKRNKKDYNKVESLERSAYVKEGDEWIPLGKITAENILGLSYDYFRRTTIVPQGKFEEFLNLTSSKRTEMLSEIFQLGKYEYSDKVSQLEKSNAEEIKHQSGKLSHYENVTPDALLEKQNALVGIEKNLNDKQTEYSAKTILFNEQQRLRQLVEERDEKLKTQTSLRGKEEEILQQKKKLKDYEYCFEHFKSSLDRRKELLTSIDQYKTNLTKAKDELKSKQEELVVKEKSLKTIQQRFDKLDDYKVELNDCKLITEALNLQKQIDELQIRIKTGEEKTKEQQNEVLQLQSEVTTLVKSHSEKEKVLPDLVEMAKAESWFENKRRFESEAGQTQELLNKLQALLVETKHALFVKLEQRFKKVLTFNSDDDFDSYAKTINAYSTVCQQSVESIDVTLSEYKLKQKLGEYAMTLQSGEPCPLCGATHHPNPLVADDVIEHVRIATKEKEALQQSMESCRQMLFEINRAQTLCQSHQIQIDTANNKLHDQQNDLVLHRSYFSWKGFSQDDEVQFKAFHEEGRKQHESFKRLRDMLESKRKSSEDAAVIAEKYKDALRTLNQKQAQLNAQYHTYLEQVRLIQFDATLHTTDYVSTRASELNNLIGDTESQYKKIRAEIETLNISIARLEQQQQSLELEISISDKRLGDTEDSIRSCLEKSSYSKREEVEAILLEKLNLEELRSKIQQFDLQLSNATADLERINNLLNNQSYDAAQFEMLEQQTKSLHQAVKDFSEERLRCQDAINKLQQDLETRKALEGTLEKLKLREENIKTLKSLFKGNGFVNYVSSVHLRRLCNAANLRYRALVNDQYHLELSAKNDFMICDHLNGGNIRDVKTMSGGQKFQVSLSLALALSDQVQQQSKAKQNFFFLDEGFGTLDKESLQLVFDSLMSLRKSNRIVGVISHVEELKQEIDYHIEVLNGGNDGSQVTYSWSN